MAMVFYIYWSNFHIIYFNFLELISTSGPSHAPQFVIRASLNDMSFEGSGKSKKDAKLNASKALLVHLHQVGFDPMTGDMMSTQQNNTDVASGHSFADKIGQLVTNKYQALFGTTTYSKRRVMAGVVMTTPSQDEEAEEDEDQFEVICVSSGTKCINGEFIIYTQCSKIGKKVQFQKCKNTLFAISKMAKNQFLHQKKV